jgi:RNA polymerase sigma-70 factor (ECF subfamily)
MSAQSRQLAGSENRAKHTIFGHGPFVMRTLRRFGVHAADVEDAAQRVFLTVANRLGDITVGAERSFLYCVAKREAGHVRRSYRRRRETPEEILEEATPESLQQDALVARKRAHATAYMVFAVLDEDCRRVFTLCELEGWTATEAARELGVPLGTVKTRLRRARATLSAHAAPMLASGVEH